MQPISAHFVSPGSILMPSQATVLQSVVTWGAIVTVFHPRTGHGGMAHFLYPKRRKDKPSNALYAAPAVVSLIRHFTSQYGKDQLEIHLIGGASYEGSSFQLRNAAKEIIKATQEIFDILHIRNVDLDIGGRRARRVIFNTETGELIIAKVDKVRKEDWMYSVQGPCTRES